VKKTLKTLPLVIALIGCTTTMSNKTTTLQPLPTTTTTPFKYSEFNYIDDFYYHFGKPTKQDNDTLLELAALWCHAIKLGMQPTDIQERINEGSADQQDAELNEAIVKSATTNLCPYTTK
jgi:hypothetical protein